MNRLALLVPIVAIVLVGCGLKGPLYLPESDRQQVPESTDEERKERTRDSGAPMPAVPTDTSGTPSSTTPPGN